MCLVKQILIKLTMGKFVTTLALGSRPSQRNLQGCGPKRSPRVTPHALESVKKCEGMNPHTPKWTFLWEMESRWTFEFSINDYKGQNSMVWRVPYINRNLLECRCLKWARMTHLDIWNMAKRKVKSQIGKLTFDH